GLLLLAARSRAGIAREPRAGARGHVGTIGEGLDVGRARCARVPRRRGHQASAARRACRRLAASGPRQCRCHVRDHRRDRVARGALAMVKNVTSLSRSGLSDFVIQRVTAVVLLVYALCVIGFLLENPDVEYATLLRYFSHPAMQLFTTLAVISIAAHAWI